MRKLLGLCLGLAVASGLYADEVKLQHKVEQDKGVQMSNEEWFQARQKMRAEQEGYTKAAIELDKTEKEITHRRWIERDGGWGIPLQIDIPIISYWAGNDSTSSVLSTMQGGIRAGVSKRHFHPNLEFRALTGIGYTFLASGSSSNNLFGGYYIPFNFEVGWAKDWQRTPSYILGIGYETASIYNKAEVYFNLRLFSSESFLRFAYGFSGNIKLNQAISIPSNSFSLGILAAF